ncbi:MAG: hypothetical protein ACK56I_11330, partial [bacterium]
SILPSRALHPRERPKRRRDQKLRSLTKLPRLTFSASPEPRNRVIRGNSGNFGVFHVGNAPDTGQGLFARRGKVLSPCLPGCRAATRSRQGRGDDVSRPFSIECR